MGIESLSINYSRTMEYRRTGKSSVEQLSVSMEGFDADSISKAKTAKDYFKEICEAYPDVSFIIANLTDDDFSKRTDMSKPYDYAGICDTASFGNLQKKSIIFHEEALKNMDNPECRKHIYEQLNYINENYQRIVVGLGGNIKSAYIEITDLGENGSSVAKYSALGSESSTMPALVNYSKNADTSRLDIHAMMLRKASLYAEEKYNEMIDSLFRGKDVSKEKPNNVDVA